MVASCYLRWEQEANLAVELAQPILPDVPLKAAITDDGRGPILDVQSAVEMTQDELLVLEYVVRSLGWRAWGIGSNGIAFKPTVVDLG